MNAAPVAQRGVCVTAVVHESNKIAAVVISPASSSPAQPTIQTQIAATVLHAFTFRTSLSTPSLKKRQLVCCPKNACQMSPSSLWGFRVRVRGKAQDTV